MPLPSQAAGDVRRAEFEALYAAFAKRVEGYTRARVRDRDEAKDVMQEAWVLVDKYLPGYNPAVATTEQFVTYWAKLAVLRHFRRTRRRAEHEFLLSGFRVADGDVWGIEAEDRLAAEHLHGASRTEDVSLVYGRLEAALLGAFSTGLSPHKLIAFGFCRPLEWRPAELDDQMGEWTLGRMAARLGSDLVTQACLPEELVRRILAPVHAALGSDEVPGVPRHTTLRSHYTTSAQVNIPQWTHMVLAATRRADPA